MSKLLPSLEVDRIQEALIDYLTTTFDLTDPDTREAARSFITDPDNGLFRGPYLNISLPFTSTDFDPHDVFDWYEGYPPYSHQAAAWARLSSKTNTTPQPTLITTGTGSGKTETFLNPILDHCKRTRANGITGTKAIIIYPMNALADDQAHRLAELITSHPAISHITAGIYTGDATSGHTRTIVSPQGLITNRTVLRQDPPDILLTNYKMLDQLLLRPEDASIWKHSADSLQYLVLDEFHTYDGAQGTDVAMLLRRLGITLNHHRTTPAPSTQPLGTITPIATSATLGTDNPHEILTFAHTIFGHTFTPDSIITENRQAYDDWRRTPTPNGTTDLPDNCFQLLPAADDANATIHNYLQRHHPDSTGHTHSSADDRTGNNADKNADYAQHLAEAIIHTYLQPDLDDTDSHTNGDTSWEHQVATDPDLVLALLQHHSAFDRLLKLATRGPISIDDLARRLFPEPPRQREHGEWQHEARTQLAYLLSFLSYARTLCGRHVPSTTIHLWIRELSRIDRAVSTNNNFRWNTNTPTDPDSFWLPALYCRHCGRSGWGAVLDPASITINTQEDPRRAAVRRDPRFRALLTIPGEARAQHLADSNQPHDPNVRWIDTTLHNITDDTPHSTDKNYQEGTLLPVLLDTSHDSDTRSTQQTCPACNEPDSIRFLGSATATQLSVSLSALLGDDHLDHTEKKALIFTDSVQDAAHRASFVQARSHTLSFRATIHSALTTQPQPLPTIITTLLDNATTGTRRFQLLPPDLADREEYQPYWDNTLPNTNNQRTNATKRVKQRLLFDAILETGTNTRYGRSLENTGAAHIDTQLPLSTTDLGMRAYTTAAATTPHQQHFDFATDPDDDPTTSPQLAAWVRGTLKHIRSQGGIGHPWLTNYLDSDGNRYTIWGGRNHIDGMPAFPRGRQAPSFPYTAGRTSTPLPKDSIFLNALGTNTWYTNWTSRCLNLPKNEAPYYTQALLDTLASAGVLHTTTTRTNRTIYYIPAENILVTSGTDNTHLECDTCHNTYAASPTEHTELDHSPCFDIHCRGTLHATHHNQNFYQKLYNAHSIERVIASEHTSLLDNDTRHTLEEKFKGTTIAADTPNVLVATPTLEMGIDIGDLNTIMLGSLPHTNASYQQRIGRAGRKHGSALALTYVRGQGPNLPRLNNPLDTINGTIHPPATFLDAQEILQRQFVAYLLDHIAATGNDAAPHKLSDVCSGSSTHLQRAIAYLHSDPETVITTFLDAFHDTLSKGADTYLRDWATPPANGDMSGLDTFISNALNTWEDSRAQLTTRLQLVQQGIAELDILQRQDPENTDRRRDYNSAKANAAQINRHLKQLNNDPWISGLEALGLLPNYTLLDDDVTLSYSVHWRKPDDITGQQGSFENRPEELTRGKASAISELAPGATFYTRNMAIHIDAIDLGTNGSDIHTWKICPACGHVDIHEHGDNRPFPTSCPRCHSTAYADQHQELKVVEMRSVSAEINRDKDYIGDRQDDRTRTLFTIATLPDLSPHNIDKHWYTTTGFSVEFRRNNTVRWLNLGKKQQSADRTLGGRNYRGTLFRVCPTCGKLDQHLGQNRTDEHRAWCPQRKQHTEHPTEIAIARTLRTQTVTLYPPIDLEGRDGAYDSLAAAIKLGLHNYIGGNPDHLDVIVIPTTDGEHQRDAILVLDTIPGGTGYLAEFSDPRRTHDVLACAYRILTDTTGYEENLTQMEELLAPYRAKGSDHHVSRAWAIEALAMILGIDSGEAVGAGEVGDSTYRNWQVTEGAAPKNHVSPASKLELTFYTHLKEQLRRENCTVEERPASYQPDLTIVTPDNIRWNMKAQQTVRSGHVTTQPDFTLKRVTGAPLTIEIYTDGRTFHAGQGQLNRLDDDATKRAALRHDGSLVWAITYQDILDHDNQCETTTSIIDLVDTPTSKPSLTTRGKNLRNLLKSFKAPTALLDTLHQDAFTQLVNIIMNNNIEDWRRLAGAVSLALPIANDALNHTSTPQPTPQPARTDSPTLPAASPASSGTYDPDTNLLSLATEQYLHPRRAFPHNPHPTTPTSDTTPVILNTHITSPLLCLTTAIPACDIQHDTSRVRCILSLDFTGQHLDPSLPGAGTTPRDTSARDNAWRRWLHLSNILGFLDSTILTTGPCLTHEEDLPNPCGTPTDTLTSTITPAFHTLIDNALDDTERTMLIGLAEAGADTPTVGEELPGGLYIDLLWPTQRLVVNVDDFTETETNTLTQAGWRIAEYTLDAVLKALAET